MVLWTCLNWNSSHQVPNPSNKAKGGWLQNLNSLASLDFGYAADGISLTTQVSPRALGKTRDEQVDNLVTILDGYFENGGQHVNLNVMDLNDVYEKIMSGEDVIVRISGYCVNTKYLTQNKNWIDTTCLPRSSFNGWCIELRFNKSYKPVGNGWFSSIIQDYSEFWKSLRAYHIEFDSVFFKCYSRAVNNIEGVILCF